MRAPLLVAVLCVSKRAPVAIKARTRNTTATQPAARLSILLQLYIGPSVPGARCATSVSTTPSTVTTCSGSVAG